MTKILQTFNFQESQYNRPNQAWVCGHRRDGRECLLGPDKFGQCQVVAECQPRKDGDRWHCTRSPGEGGKCEDGPLSDGSCCRRVSPCQPTRSLRNKRGVLSLWVVTVILGLLVLGFSIDKSWLLSPGELSSKHASLEDCSGCHTNFNSSVSTWLHQTMRLAPGDDATACLSCHSLGESAFMPHSLSQTKLTELSRLHSVALSSADLGSAHLESTDIENANIELALYSNAEVIEAPSCGVCHREHQGIDNTALSSLSNERCHSCHQQKFSSFSQGHPEFDQYPYMRRTRIQFDHSSHFNKHFGEDDFADLAPEGCKTCHQTDVHGQTMEVSSYEDSCGACHDDQIRGLSRAGAKGIAVMAVPELDVDSLAAAGFDLGGWPDRGAENIPPLMDFMLSAHPDYRLARETTRKLDLYDLSDATFEQLRSAAIIAWQIKQFYYDGARQGSTFFQNQILSSSGAPVSDAELAALLNLLPQSALLEVERELFPALTTDVEAFRVDPVARLAGSLQDFAQQVAPEPVSAVIIDSTDQSDIDTSDISLDGDIELDDISLDDDIDLGGDISLDDEIELGDDDISLEDDAILDDDIGLGEEIGLDDDIDLGDDDIDGGDISLDDDIDLSDEDDIGFESEIDLSDEEFGDLASDDSSSGSSVDDLAAVYQTDYTAAERWARSGGWYWEEQILYYRPVGHADKFVQSWVDAVTGSPTVPAARIFADLAGENAVGSCSKCHSIDEDHGDETADQEPRESYRMNWMGRQAELNTKTFTRFSHQTHADLLSETGCATCHQLDADADYAQAYEGHDPKDFDSNFTPMDINTCAACHTPSNAGDGCFLCHNYHIGSFPPPMMNMEDKLLGRDNE